MIAVTLLQIAMQTDGRHALGRQVVDNFLHLLLGEAEGHAGLRAEAGEQLDHRVHALLGGDLVEALLDL